ncbi:MAG: UMP kinase [Candidatus Marinimicrobia bacterium]|nr:UMP kinase [Candidatus Neomarinimicrobiota bacterium]|tara:strand:- start:6945 stop:7664 length:720 start_codon:yes stop_codon:yes gene_type:complete
MARKNTSFNRILLKISGEVLAGEKTFGIDPNLTQTIAARIKKIHSQNKEIGIVIGGGNIFRGMAVSEQGMDRVAADYLGMMATIMNSVALQSELEKVGCDTRVMSALSVTQLAEPYIRRRATRHLEKKRIVIFAGGTGNPYFTTDTAAVLRGVEINADVIIKGTKVDGIYSSDPMKNSDAVKYDELTFDDVIHKNLKIMDMTAFTLCKENNIPIVVLDINDKNSLYNLMKFNNVGTLVS